MGHQHALLWQVWASVVLACCAMAVAQISPAPSGPASSPAASAPSTGSGGWKQGRATYYGAPLQITQAYDPSRGEGAFGIIAFGACGYTNQPKGDLPFPIDSYAAMADANPDYPGSCGRCYELRCKSGLVLDNNGQPITISRINATSNTTYYQGDIFRPVLFSINASVEDTKGRSFLGNPAESKNQSYTKCWDDNKSLVVRIGDQCPCKQVLAETAPGVKKGGEVRRQEWCCGPMEHFDLSYWAFEQLAHPVNGVMMLEYRPVDCDTKQPISPNYISSTIYSSGDSGIQPGWAWWEYNCTESNLLAPGSAPNGGLSTCVRMTPAPGGLAFVARQAGQPGFQPFAGKSAVQFWIKPNSNSTDPYFSATPTGQIPPLKVFLLNEENKRYCGAEPTLGNTTLPLKQQGDWYQFQIPLSDFKCSGLVDQSELNRLDFQNTAPRDAFVCLTDIKLV